MIHIVTIIDYSSLRIEGEYSNVTISDIRITERLNDHARLVLTGVIPENDKDTYAMDTGGYGIIKLVHVPDDENPEIVVIFSGLVEQVSVDRVHNVYGIELMCISHTYLLDVTITSESFQDKNMTFCETVGRVLIVQLEENRRRPGGQLLEAQRETGCRRTSNRKESVVVTPWSNQ